jgi:hypothetical protein
MEYQEKSSNKSLPRKVILHVNVFITDVFKFTQFSNLEMKGTYT